MLSYSSKAFSMSLGTNKWSGLHNQQTGIIGLGSGDFSLSYENDGAPFGGKLGDNNDRYRTAAVNLSIGEFSAGFNYLPGKDLKKVTMIIKHLMVQQILQME